MAYAFLSCEPLLHLCISESMHLLQTDTQADMDAEMASPVPEGAPPKSAVEVVQKFLPRSANTTHSSRMLAFSPVPVASPVQLLYLLMFLIWKISSKDQCSKVKR